MGISSLAYRLRAWHNAFCGCASIHDRLDYYADRDDRYSVGSPKKNRGVNASLLFPGRGSMDDHRDTMRLSIPRTGIQTR